MILLFIKKAIFLPPTLLAIVIPMMHFHVETLEFDIKIDNKIEHFIRSTLQISKVNWS